MPRFIVRYRGPGAAPPDLVQRAEDAPDIRLVDRSTKMILVEAEEGPVQRVFADSERFSVSPEQFVPLPTSKPKIRKK
ncbi:MAG: hypothetical protein ACKVZJ_09810 [Phycisphaerales bacterium]